MNDLGKVCTGCRLLEAISSSTDKPIVVAPHSFYFRDFDFFEFLNKIPNKIYLFCRERASFEDLKKLGLPTQDNLIFLSPDTAFYLSRSDIIKRVTSCKKRDGEVLCSFRKGTETKLSFADKKVLIDYLKSNGKKILKEDVSAVNKYEDFIQNIERHEVIFTDRLHVAILGSILEKNVFLFPNIYFKNRAVYEYSLKEYTKTHFCNSIYDCIKLISETGEVIR